MPDQATYCTTAGSASKTHSSEAVQIADVLCWTSWNGNDMQSEQGSNFAFAHLSCPRLAAATLLIRYSHGMPSRQAQACLLGSPWGEPRH